MKGQTERVVAPRSPDPFPPFGEFPTLLLSSFSLSTACEATTVVLGAGCCALMAERGAWHRASRLSLVWLKTLATLGLMAALRPGKW